MDENVILSSGKMEKSLTTCITLSPPPLLIIFQVQISFSVDTVVIAIHS